MARIESVSRAQFYPTPDRVTQAVARHLERHPGVGKNEIVRVLDPCAGTGEPVEHVTKALGGESYAVELSRVRSDKVRPRVNYLLAGTDAMGTKIAERAFTLLFLNPPYDYDDEGERLENVFLMRFAPKLAAGGVLVFIVPQARVGQSAKCLSSQFTDLRIYRFPDPEWAAFKQVVVFGVKKPNVNIDLTLFDQILHKWPHRQDLPELPDEPVGDPYLVQGKPRQEILFAPTVYDPERALAEAARIGAWSRHDFIDLVTPPPIKKVRPLMPIRRGHLAMLMAAGLLDDCVLEQDGDRLLVKGTMRKVMVDVPNDDPEDTDTRIQREKLEQSLEIGRASCRRRVETREGQ